MKLTLILTAAVTLFFLGCNQENQAENTMGAPDLLQSAFEADSDTEFDAPPCKGRSIKGYMGKLIFADVIELTDAQKAQIKEIMREKRSDLKAMRKKMKGLSFEAQREKRKEHRTNMLEAILPVLTETQREKVEAIHNQFENGEVPEELIDARLKRMTEKLSLTEAQQTQIKPILTDFSTKKLQTQQSATSREELREAMQLLRNEKQEKLDTILTEEQKLLCKKNCNRKDKRNNGRKLGKGARCNR